VRKSKGKYPHTHTPKSWSPKCVKVSKTLNPKPKTKKTITKRQEAKFDMMLTTKKGKKKKKKRKKKVQN
jgi:hypothetical protein